MHSMGQRRMDADSEPLALRVAGRARSPQPADEMSFSCADPVPVPVPAPDRGTRLNLGLPNTGSQCAEQ